jgi:hypothetical protein
VNPYEVGSPYPGCHWNGRGGEALSGDWPAMFESSFEDLVQ